MSVLRPVSLWIRKRLTDLHLYSVCCASCGEITNPLGNRLCTSLAPFFTPDAVLLSPGGTLALPDLEALRDETPWIKTFWVEGLDRDRDGLRGFSAKVLREKTDDFLPTEALLHKLPGLGEQYLVIRDRAFFDPSGQVLDYFTPNGIPLLFYPLNDADTHHAMAKDATNAHPRVFAHTTKNSREFLAVLRGERLSAPLDADVYLARMSLWTYEQAKAIACGPAMIRTTIPLTASGRSPCGS